MPGISTLKITPHHGVTSRTQEHFYHISSIDAEPAEQLANINIAPDHKKNHHKATEERIPVQVARNEHSEWLAANGFVNQSHDTQSQSILSANILMRSINKMNGGEINARPDQLLDIVI